MKYTLFLLMAFCCGTSSFAKDSGHPSAIPSADSLRRSAAAPYDVSKLGGRIISIAPIQFTYLRLGVGLSYECALDRQGIVAFHMPAIFGYKFGSVNDANKQQKAVYDPMFFVMPGLKYYPCGSRSYINYSLGAHLVFGQGTETVSQNANFESYTHTTFGTMLNQTLNVNASEHLYMALDFGLGVAFLAVENRVNQNERTLIQGGFKVGYRF